MINFRNATGKDAFEFYGKVPEHSFKGIVAIKDERVIGIGGLFFMKGSIVAFSDMKPEMKESKKSIVKGMRMLVDMIKKETRPVYAIADPNEATSCKLLAKLGFVGTGIINPDGETLVWEGK
jgi:hypothetical protein